MFQAKNSGGNTSGKYIRKIHLLPDYQNRRQIARLSEKCQVSFLLLRMLVVRSFGMSPSGKGHFIHAREYTPFRHRFPSPVPAFASAIRPLIGRRYPSMKETAWIYKLINKDYGTLDFRQSAHLQACAVGTSSGSICCILRR